MPDAAAASERGADAAAALTRSPDSATEVAQALADLVRDKAAFPDAAARHLADLLGHSLAVGTPGERRQARLGLLIELVSGGEGEFITSGAYEEARQSRRERGEEWPAASTLSRAYGHWLTALRAACRFWFEGGRARVASDHAHAKRNLAYLPQEILSALLQAQAELGLQRRVGAASDGVAGSEQEHWPTEWEYLEWARIKRRLARRAGAPCRLPERGVIRAAYGSYAEAIEAAMRQTRGSRMRGN